MSMTRGAGSRRQPSRPSSSAVLFSSRSAGRREQPLAGAVDEAQAVGAVEREDGDVDLLHHLAQQRGGLERAEPLLAQRVGERVGFDHHFAERHRRSSAPCARTEKSPSRSAGEQVRQRLQGIDDAAPERGREAPPGPDDEYAERPADLGGVVAGQSSVSETMTPGSPAASAMKRILRSWLRNRRQRDRREEGDMKTELTRTEN